MRNLENTEKSLKHWLKNKVTITTATVVGFLIMGTVSFGAVKLKEETITAPIGQNVNTVSGEQYTSEQEIIKVEMKDNTLTTQEKAYTNKFGIRDVNASLSGARNSELYIFDNAKVTLEENSSIKNIGGNETAVSLGSATFVDDTNANINNKEVIFTNKGNIESKVVGVNGITQTVKSGTEELVNVYKKMKVVNEGKISINNESTGTNFVGIRLSAVNSDNTPANDFVGEIINNGTISVDGKNQELLFGIQAVGNVKIENNKDIIVNGKGGISQEGKVGTFGIGYSKGGAINEKAEIINNGTISVNKDNSTSNYSNGIYALTDENTDLTITNGANGIINVGGNGTSGAKLEGGKYTFVNDGEINVVSKDGVGIIANGTGTATNNGVIKVQDTAKAFEKGDKATATNNGVIQITNKTAEELKNEKFDENKLFGNATNNGMIADKTGVDINNSNSLTGDIYTSKLVGESLKIGFGNQSNLIGDGSPANVKTLNVVGKVGVKNGQGFDGAYVAVDTLNFDKNGQFNVTGGNNLYLGDDNKKIVINQVGGKEKELDKIVVGDNSKLGLTNATVSKGVNISGTGSVFTSGETTINSNVTSKDFEVFDGKTLFNGVLTSNNVTVGHDSQSKDVKLTLSSGASFGTETTINTTNGTTVFEIGDKGENALANSQKKVTINGNIDFDTNNLTTNTTVKLNNEKEHIEHNLSGAKYQDKTDRVYNTHLDKDKNTLEFAYNKALYNNTPELNGLNNIMQGLNDKLSQNVTERANQLDEIYAGNIYSETVRAGYDNIKLNEETVLSLGKTAKAGELKTHGKALYTKDEYTRNGALNNFDADVETTGLFAGAEYGLSDTMSVGAVFSGAKQDVNVSNGSADGDLFYLGVYGTKVVGNYDFTAGLGYQLGKYDADYNMAKGLTASEKYDSNAVNGYVQGRYTANLGDGLSVQPKVKLGYTYIEQDDVNDNNYKVSDAEVSTFDTEVGVDVVKSVQFEKSKLDVKFGTSYIKAMGDTDKKFTLSTKDGSAEILGAELAENTLKFALDAEVENENGFFYNAGVNYRFGSEDTEAYSVNAGVGYKF